MTQIHLCPTCNGQGTLERKDREGYEKFTCGKCEGAGRIERKSYSVDLPFGADIDHDTEKKIFELLTKLKKQK